jgi:hypothetical protein
MGQARGRRDERFGRPAILSAVTCWDVLRHVSRGLLKRSTDLLDSMQ